jgi:hypothetical protein
VNDPNNGKVVYKGYTFYFWEISAYEHAIRMEITKPVSAGVLALITAGSPNSYYSGLKNIGGGFYENSQGEIISASGVVFYLNGLDPSGKYVVGKNGEVGYYVNVDFHEVWGVGSMVEGNYKEARRYHRYSHSERVWVGLGKKQNFLDHNEASSFLSGVPLSLLMLGLPIADFILSASNKKHSPVLAWIGLNYAVKSEIANQQLKTLYDNYMENKNQNGIYFIEVYTPSFIPGYGLREWQFFDANDNKYLGSYLSY